MSFVHPEFLWGLSLLIIPVIIHLFNFKRYKTLYFSSLQFVKKVDQQTKSTQRLRHLLILMSRLLALAFLVFAFAQPYLTDNNETIEEVTKVTPIYIDNSFSMEAKGAEGQLLSQAKEKAKDVVEGSDVNSLFLIGTNDMSGLEERLLNKAEAVKRIDEIEPSPISKTVTDVINWQTDILRKNNIVLKGIDYILFSDFQKIQENIQSIENPEVTFIPVRVKPENMSNLSLDSVWFSSPVHRMNDDAELNISVRNHGAQAIENVEIGINLGTVKKQLYLNIDPNSTNTTSVTFKEKERSWISGTITVADEQLFFDNDMFLSYQVSDHVNVLLIDGEDKVDNFSIVYNLDDYYQVKSVKETLITREDLENNDLIILNGVNRLSTGLIDNLTKFVTGGGTLGLFPGSKVDFSSWNLMLTKLNLNTFKDVLSTGTRLDKIAYEDPFFKGVFDRKPSSLNLPAQNKAYLSSGGKGIPLINMKNGKPLFMYTSAPGTAFCFYSSLHEDFGQFVNDALYSTLCLRLGEISKRQQPLYLTIGSDVSYPIYNANTSEQAIKIKKDDFEAIPESETLNNIRYIKIDRLSDNVLEAGNYQVLQNNESLAAVSLNYDRVESSRNYLSDEDIIQLLGGKMNELKIREISSTSQFNIKDVEKPFSYWKLCIVLTLIFVIAEMAIVRFYK